MNGYLQCLIDQYESKTRKAIGGAERSIYRDILNDLLKFQRYAEGFEESQEPTIDDIPKKYIVTGFKGDMSGFIEYLKNLRRGE
ncbi:hypothetical protein AB8U03_00250 [Clostridium sp. Mt-5]|uniref:Uncharacterized protein n=1 Tax=Clostridium moutaii TaxID=3240932 RepID=A0ABV4BK72_9CLOT